MFKMICEAVSLATFTTALIGLGIYAQLDVWEMHDRCRTDGDTIACMILSDDLPELDRFTAANTQ